MIDEYMLDSVNCQRSRWGIFRVSLSNIGSKLKCRRKWKSQLLQEVVVNKYFMYARIVQRPLEA